MEGGQPLLDYYSLLTIIFWFAINILIWGIIIILHKVYATSTTSYTNHEDTSVVNKVVPDDGIDDDTITGTDNDDIGERELRSWYLAITSTKPLTNPFPKTDYRLNLRNAYKLPTMLESVSEKTEEGGIKEYYDSEVCTVDSSVMNSTTVDGSDGDDGKEFQSWYHAVATTKPFWPETDYRLNLRNFCRLPTILELPVSEKMEEMGIEEYYYSEVHTAYNNVMNSTTVDGSDNDDCDEELRSWHSPIATTKLSPNPWPKTENYRNTCKLPTMLELSDSEEMEEVGIDEYYDSDVCTANNNVMDSTTVDGSDNDDGGGVIHEDYENDDSQCVTDGLEGHSCDCEGTTMDSMKKVVTDGIESECEICVGQSFGPRDDGYNSMIDFVKEEQGNTDFKESVIKQVVELDETFKTIIDALEEEHQAEMTEQQKRFDRELKVKLEQQMQLFIKGVKKTVIKRLVELDEGFEIVWKMVDTLEEVHQSDMMEQEKTLEEKFGRKLVEKENIMAIQQQIKLEEDRKKFEEEMYAKLADLRRKMEAKKEEQEIQGLSKHFTFTLTEAQQSQVDEIEKQFDEKISKAKETYKKKSEVLKEKNKPDLELQSQYLIEDKEWKFCKRLKRWFNKKLRKVVKAWKKKKHKVGVASPTEQ